MFLVCLLSRVMLRYDAMLRYDVAVSRSAHPPVIHTVSYVDHD